MAIRAKPATIISASVGIAAYLLERGLDMAGVTISLGWAVVLWVISGVLIVFAAIVGFKTYLWPILRTIRVVRLREEEMAVQSRVTDLTQKYADWMTAALNRDINNFPRCIFIHNLRIDWTHLKDDDSYFLIHCDVYSSSVFRIDIGKNVDGHLFYKNARKNAELEKIPEIKTPIEQLERSVSAHLIVQQWVSQPMMNTIALDGGSEVTLVFTGVNIWVNAKYPDGSVGPICRLPLPHEYKVDRLPTQVELQG